MHELSVIFLTYNPQFDAVKESLDSIIAQKDVDLEIIIADDGSKDSPEAEIRQYFSEKGFKDYRMVMNPVNGGLVANLYSGLEAADSEYTKVLSPGDRFYADDSARGWIDFMKAKGAKWSFCEAVYYYKDENGQDKHVSGEAKPLDVTPYLRGDSDRCRWNYLVYKDITIGALALSETALQREYCKRIMDAGVKFSEDNMWRILMFEGETGAYYPEPAVLYEYGTGMSTSGSDAWAQRLLKDWKITDRIMRETPDPDSFQLSVLDATRDDLCAVQKLFIKGKLMHVLKRRFRKRMTQI